MTSPREPFTMRLCRRVIEGAALLVPAGERDDWRETWLGELYHHARALERRGPLEGRSRLDLLRRSLGAVSHALWLWARQFRLETVRKDLLVGARNGWRQPGLTLVVLLTLALGIGANSSLFSVVDGLLLHPFPYRDIDRLVALGATFPQISSDERFVEALSLQDYRTLEAQSRTLEDFLAFDLGNRDLGGVETPERLFTAAFWGDPFATLGMAPALGRAFTREEMETNAPVAIISHRLWQRRFGGDPGVVGGPIVVNGAPRTLVGVMPERLLLFDTDLWLPMWYAGADLPRSRRVLTVLARLRDGAALDEARSELSTFAASIEEDTRGEAPEYAGFRLAPMPFLDVWAGFVGPGGPLLLAAVAFVLFIACANIAGLLLARASARRHEMAVRAAMGASRLRLGQQLLTEALLIAFAGAGLGLLVAHWALELTAARLPEGLPLGGIELGINRLVLLYTAGLSLFSGAFFGIVPALAATRIDPRAHLAADGARTGGGSRVHLTRRLFVGLQVALSVVLLSGAGLLLKSLDRLASVDPGVSSENVLTMRITLAWERYGGKVVPFYERLLEELSALPGVRRAAIATQFPPLSIGDRPFRVEGRPVAAEGTLPSAHVTVASEGLFDALGMTLVAGRSWSATDDAEAPVVCLVNRTLARRYFPGESPLGRRIRVGGSDSEAPWATIVGTVSDARNEGLSRPVAPEIFQPFRQSGESANQVFVLLRTEAEPMGVLPAMREALGRLDPDQPVYAIQTLDERLGSTLLTRKLVSLAFVALAATALFLACMGLYGVVAYLVSERRREFGIRLALGASSTDLVASVVWAAVRIAGAGVLVGLGGAYLLSRSLAGLLYEVRPNDPAVLGGVALLLLAVSVAATAGPARRIARVDPSESFR